MPCGTEYRAIAIVDAVFRLVPLLYRTTLYALIQSMMKSFILNRMFWSTD
ncbi:MAG: hypothetical protein QXG40_03120 [Ignisphaera sp.]